MLDDYYEMMERCIRCSLCKWIPQIQIRSQEYASICPSIDEYNFHNYSGGGKIITGLMILEGRVPFNKKLLEVVFACTECGGCDISCKYLNSLEVLEIIQLTREELVKKGHGPLPNQQIYVKNVMEVHNPYGEPHEDRFQWLPDNVKITPGAELGYFVGCTSSYRRQEIALATISVFNKLGIEFSLLGPDEFCCGSPMYRVGEIDKAKELMNNNLDKIQKAGIKTLITSCAGCYTMFKAEYSKVLDKELPFKILHTSELLETLLKDGKLTFSQKLAPTTVTYHDPCHLGRCSEPYLKWEGKMVEVMPLIKIPIPPKPKRQGSNGVYEPPRNVLKQIPGIQLVEMERIKEYSYCCGAGGGVKAQFPEFAVNTAKRRIIEAKSTGASVLASCCPFCKTNLQDGIDASGTDMKFKDLIELVDKVL
ncbi:MAG: (Fe-S)-binding protein [Promethearchaeota archaeon]